MVYIPFDWRDNIDMVDEAHLDHMEQGIATADAAAAANAAALPGKENKSEKGAALGYTPLDGTSKVPLAFLPPIAPGGASLAFLGDWAAGTYQDGDVAVRNGIAFMCVGGPTAVAPDETLWGLASTIASIGTTLPASPVDGQEAILVDSLTAPTYSWRFRYVAAITGTKKWLFIGGAPATASVSPDESTASGFPTWVDLATVGPSIVVPRAGDYLCRYGCNGSNTVTGSGWLINARSTNVVEQDIGIGGVWAQPLGAAAGLVAASKQVVLPSVVAGDTIKMRYAALTSGTAHFDRRYLEVQPVRVA
jgi:hypothetical protein